MENPAILRLEHEQEVLGKTATRPTERLEVLVLWADTVTLEPGRWNHLRIPDSHWRLYQNDASGGKILADSGEYNLHPGRVYLIPPNRRLGTRGLARFRQFYLHFDLVGAPGLALADLFPDVAAVPASLPFQESIRELAESLTQGWRGDIAAECWMKGGICEALGRFLNSLPVELRERYRLRQSALQAVLPAIRQIQERYGERITNAALAVLCHMSEDYFIRRFREAVGMPPAQYLTRRRIAVAAQRLLFTDDTLEQIAETTGFCDRFYFSRVFAREAGMPPATFRRGPKS